MVACSSSLTKHSLLG